MKSVLSKTLKTSLILTVIFSIGVGIGVSFQTYTKTQRVRDERTALHTINTQSQMLADMFLSRTESIKAKIATWKSLTEKNRSHFLKQNSSILYISEFQVSKGKITKVIQSGTSPHWKISKKLLKELENQTIKNFKLKKTALTTISTPKSKKEMNHYLSVGFLESKENLFTIAVVNPVTAFPIFRDFSKLSRGGTKKAYMIDPSGFILTHSNPKKVGNNLKSSKLFSKGIGLMLKGKRKNGAGQYTLKNNQNVIVAYARPNKLPIALAIEQTAPIIPSFFLSILIPKNIALFFFAIGAIFLLCFIPNLFSYKRKNKPSKVTMKYFSHQELTKNAHEKYNCMSLFFQYSEQTQIATLEADSGFEENKVPFHLSFPLLSKEIQFHPDKNTPLKQHLPLKNIIDQHFSDLFFQAWIVPSKNLKTPRMSGVLVLLSRSQKSLPKANNIEPSIKPNDSTVYS